MASCSPCFSSILVPSFISTSLGSVSIAPVTLDFQQNPQSLAASIIIKLFLFTPKYFHSSCLPQSPTQVLLILVIVLHCQTTKTHLCRRRRRRRRLHHRLSTSIQFGLLLMVGGSEVVALMFIYAQSSLHHYRVPHNWFCTCCCDVVVGRGIDFFRNQSSDHSTQLLLVDSMMEDQS